MKPICYDLYCGLGGWSEGFLAEGYECIGFDIEAHRYPKRILPDSQAIKQPGAALKLGRDREVGESFNSRNEKMLRDAPLVEGEWEEYPGTLILRDIRSIHGSELKDAAVIVASPPCQAYSYRAMPWKRAKALPPPDNTLFNECFRIQREAIEAAGHHIPMIVENVRGAQPWVGRARWKSGSFCLWGDVPALMPICDPRKGFAGFKGFKDFHDCEAARKWSSKHPRRKQWSAEIAKIPLPLSTHIARCFKPRQSNLEMVPA